MMNGWPNRSEGGAGMHGSATGRRGFTLIELLVGVIVMGALMGLLIVGLTRAGRFARQAASQQTLSGLKQATTQFKSEFGFVPPLVYDGEDMGSFDPESEGAVWSTGPVYDLADRFPEQYPERDRFFAANVYQLGRDETRDFLRGVDIADELDAPDPRYSKFSLAFYLAGALESGADGVIGPGMSRPLPEGGWAGTGDPLGGSNRTYEPFLDTGKRSLRIEREYFDQAEADALADGGTGTEPGDMANRLALVDGNGKAYRYYRWLHGTLEGGQVVEPRNTLELNIPGVLLDPVLHEQARTDPTIDVTEGDVRLRGATWAIVSAGQNGLFGDEMLEELKARLNVPGSMDEAMIRREAASDNVLEVGE